MNTLSEPLLPEVDFLTMAHIEEARAQAQASSRRVVEILEESLGVPPAEFTIALAQALRFPALSNDRMHSLPPAFDVLPFAEAAAHECVLLRGEGGELLLAIGDPFVLDLQAWAGERLVEAFTYCLAHRGDISAFLVSLEKGMRAMDGMVSVESGSQDARRGIEDLSLKAINENMSPVVKLVNSTLYDALKTGQATSIWNQPEADSPSSTASTAFSIMSARRREAQLPSRSSRASR